MKRTILAAAVLAVAACKNDPVGPEPQEPAVVAVTTPQTVLVVGGSVTLTATVFDASGKKINNAPVQWTSLNPDVASVSGQGVVTGIAVGEVTIEAESSGRKGSVVLTVDPDPCTNPINLSVGQVRTLSGPDAVACITLAATTGSSDFLFVTANATQAQDNTAFYSVLLNGGSAAEVAAAARQSVIDPRQQLEMQAMRYAAVAEERMRMQGRDLFRRVRPALRGGNPFKPSASIAAAAALAEGDIVTIRVPDINASNLCMTYKEVQAVVKKTTAHATIVQDAAAPSNGFSPADFTEIANEFESLVYPSTRTYFGNETDRNGDGRVTILYTPEVNKATPSGSAGFVAGFFWPGDLVKKSEYQAIGDQCPQTNEQEIFYMLVPDPAGTINSNQRSVALVKQNTRGTIAHEFQHMINQGIRLLNPAVDSAETTWLNEALSHMAEEVVGRTKYGYGDFQRLSFSDVNPSGNQDDYNAFFRQNLARYRGWMLRPDTSSPTSQAVGRQLAPRGAAWMFLRYATDHHSNNNMKAFLRSVVAGPDVGLRNLLQHAGGAQFDDLLSGWLISQFTDGLAIPGLPPRYRMLSWDVHDVMTGVNGGNTFPLLVTPLPNSVDTKSISGSGNYFRLTRVGASPETTFRMVAPSGSILNVPGARVYVVRIG